MAQQNATEQVVELTPEKALQILDASCSSIRGTRNEHAIAEASTKLLAVIIAEWKEMKREKTESGTRDDGKIVEFKKGDSE